jgi:hypothetical protein
MIDNRYNKPIICNQCGRHFNMVGSLLHLFKVWCVFSVPNAQMGEIVTKIGVEVIKEDFQKENSINRIDKPEEDRL